MALYPPESNSNNMMSFGYLHEENLRLKAKITELKAALQNLIDEQNGVPLIRRQAQYNKALTQARNALCD
jgi:hypothetical protein